MGYISAIAFFDLIEFFGVFAGCAICEFFGRFGGCAVFCGEIFFEFVVSVFEVVPVVLCW